MKYKGIVEGFYWTKDCAVEGHYGEFQFNMRNRLIKFMGKKELNAYIYDPKIFRGDNYERAYNISLIGDIKEWRKTFLISGENKIQFFWGLAPGTSKYWELNKLKNVMNHLLDLGVSGFMFLFDDVPGGNENSEIRNQGDLLIQLDSEFPGLIKGFCPGNYCGTKKELEKNLSLLHKNLPIHIPFILTGKKVWCDSIMVEDLPCFSGREIIIWDNWMASDTNDPKRLEFSPPQHRLPQLFENISGYFLNPCFPVERIIPMVSAVGEIISKKLIVSEYKSAILPNGNIINWYEHTETINELLITMGNDWAEFLEASNPITTALIFNKVKKVDLDLSKNEALYGDFKSLILKCPSLECLFQGEKIIKNMHDK